MSLFDLRRILATTNKSQPSAAGNQAHPSTRAHPTSMFHSSSTITTTSSSSFRDATLFPPASCTTATHAVDGAPPRGFIDVNASGFLPSSASSSSSLLPRSLPRSSSSHLLPVYHPTTHPFKPMPFSFPLQHQPRHQNTPPELDSPSSPPSSSSCDFPHFKACPMRRVFSTGDLQRLTGMVVSGENHNQEGGEIAAKAARYKPEERKERIVRYRSRRKHRNFHKKITYACRKTLADSRPRVRGRFARNGETDGRVEVETDAAENSCEQADGGREVGDGSDRSRAAPTAGDEYDDEDIWAAISDVLSMNLLS
ncbi:two-component response regulator-like APRR7 [Musa acuminata AAA Group]|uniref:two-component response regulator-like APRR7 n=1 Tax=Musa acuminata AAA Group TaxID=214697 RepID=UPI0031DFE196